MRSNYLSYTVICALFCVLFNLGVQPASADVTRPFRGNITGEFVCTPTSEPLIFRGKARAVGTGIPIGNFSKITDDIFNRGTGEITGAFEMTLGSGDIVRGRYSGSSVANPDSTFHWILDAIVNGGTGKFKNASGKFVFRAKGTYEIVDGSIHGKYSESFDGVISY